MRILDGTGRINAGQGAVMTVQGIGASLSPAIGGWIAQEVGYGPMFLILGAFAAVSVALWIVFAPLLKPPALRDLSSAKPLHPLQVSPDAWRRRRDLGHRSE